MNSSPPHFSGSLQRLQRSPPTDLAGASRFHSGAVPQMVTGVPQDFVDMTGQPARSQEALAAHHSGFSSVLPAAHRCDSTQLQVERTSALPGRRG
ncbi:hypothetical protein CYMTET_33453 [Cymbomonas tetramitiformis]|uniref:Uncharacterized protein n=1 Tax=Cymbomonas tetramitiformis TaxID=36881 RepID=A0AAE0FD74_9CHLO|nr:hypothetical protein CYMTET_33453 [Cymbomonas tetramitiformis]